VNDLVLRGRIILVYVKVEIDRPSYKLGQWRTCPFRFGEQLCSAVFVEADGCSDHDYVGVQAVGTQRYA